MLRKIGVGPEKLPEKEEVETCFKTCRKVYICCKTIRKLYEASTVKKAEQKTFEELKKENDFKQREISFPEDWEVVNYIKVLRKLKPILEKEFKVSRIGIFGSFVRNEQGKGSDIDIIVKFSEPIGLRFIELAEFLEEKLGRKVDLVSSEGISPYIMPYIEKEVIYI